LILCSQQRWLKDESRRKEVACLMQGLELKAPPLCSEDLPPPLDQPCFPASPPGPHHEVTEPEDTTGQAERMATSGTRTRVGPRVLVSVLSSDVAASLPASVVGCLFCNNLLMVYLLGITRGRRGAITTYKCVLYITHCTLYYFNPISHS